jgi:hypothetical protein
MHGRRCCVIGAQARGAELQRTAANRYRRDRRAEQSDPPVQVGPRSTEHAAARKWRIGS